MNLVKKCIVLQILRPAKNNDSFNKESREWNIYVFIS